MDVGVLELGQGIEGVSGAWYSVEQLVGQGRNAATYLVVCTEGPHRGVPFALKFLLRMAEPQRRAAFLAEAEFLKGCNHPSVMRVFDDGTFTLPKGSTAGEYPFLVAEYLPQTLEAVIRSGAAATTEKAIFATQLVSALVFLAGYEPAVIHRDIKPSNIFVKGQTCVLGDFGLLKRADGLDESDREVLKETVGPGMPHDYRTPDLVAYARQETMVTPKSDVFQLGLVLTELFTGRNPCRPAQSGDTMSPVELDRIGHIPYVDGGLVATILKSMLTMDPEARPSAAELLDSWTGVFDKAAEQSRALNGSVFAGR